jgi:hypothetical protein
MANWTLYTRSAPSLQLFDPPLCVFHRYWPDSEHNLLSNLDPMAERRLHRLTVYVRQRYDRGGSEHGRNWIMCLIHDEDTNHRFRWICQH